MKRKKLSPVARNRKKISSDLERIMKNSITVKPRNKPKNQIIYVRFEGDDVKKLDRFKRKLKFDTRSEVVRDLTRAAMSSKGVQKYF